MLKSRADETPAVKLLDEHSYKSEAELKLADVETVSGEDLDICYDGPCQDIRCHDTDPEEDIDNVDNIRLFPVT